MVSGKKFIESITAARRGLALVFEQEQNFRIHTAFGIAAIVLSIVLRVGNTDFLIICLTVAFVLGCEIANTGMEHFLDVIKPRISPVVRDIKDIMAGLVLCAALLSIIVGFSIFLPRIIALFYVA